MHVMTLHGGFRGLRGGLGSLSTEQQIALGESFNPRVDPFFAAHEEVRSAAIAGQLPAITVRDFDARYQTIADRIESQQQKISALESEADVAAWRRAADAIVRDANVFVRDVRVRLGYERSSRGVQIAIAVSSSVAVLGGLAWIFYRASRG